MKNYNLSEWNSAKKEKGHVHVDRKFSLLQCSHFNNEYRKQSNFDSDLLILLLQLHTLKMQLERYFSPRLRKLLRKIVKTASGTQRLVIILHEWHMSAFVDLGAPMILFPFDVTGIWRLLGCTGDFVMPASQRLFHEKEDRWKLFLGEFFSCGKLPRGRGILDN